MKAELGLESGRVGKSTGSGAESGSSGPTRPDSDRRDCCYALRSRPSEANGFYVYTRSKRLKTRGAGRIGSSDDLEGESGVSVEGADAVNSNGEVVVNGGDAVSAGGLARGLGDLAVRGVGNEGEMMEIEVKEEPFVAPKGDGPRRFTRSMLKSKEMENEDSQNLKDAVILEADGLASENQTLLGSPETRKLEMKMSKKIVIKGRPTTVRELFETGLLEGYPVFYNGGKKGFPLRGTIKDGGILCTCSFCKGAQVVPPCQFEIHACNSYRRASQYICLENGKSLLEVVRECRNSSLKTLEETIHKFIGPMPVTKTVICGNCKGSFIATNTAKLELLCDPCMTAQNSEFEAECAKSGTLEPNVGFETLEPNVGFETLEPNVGLGMSENELHKTPRKRGRPGRKKKEPSEPLGGLEMSENAELHGTTPKRGRPRKKEGPSQLTYTKSTGKRGRKKGQSKIKNILPASASAIKSPRSSARCLKSSAGPTADGSISMNGLLRKNITRTATKKLSNATHSKPLKSESPPSVSVQSKSSLKITKKDQRMHKLVFEDGGLPDGTEVGYYSNGKKLRQGYKKGSGIFCDCCSSLVSPSQFEAHAGWASRRKPYMYIYTSNGVSLHEFAVSLLRGRDCPSKENDDLCIICADGGKLVLCDGCPRAFHKECASLSNIPQGKWYCTYCQNMFQRERFVEWNANAVAAGRVAGIDPIEQINNRCIRIVKNPEEAEVIACVICRGKDFSKSGFGPRTVILCDQCEKEYHVGCLKKCKMADLKELPKGKWFCSASCNSIYSELQDLLNAGEEKLSDSSLDIIKEKQTEKTSVVGTDIDVRWRILNGKSTSRETRVLLSQAVAIFHETFAPIVDPETGRDFIPSLVYGRNIRGQDFGGMYCAILTVDSTVVSAGILRIFGDEIAELPLVATSKGDQGKGYFQALYSRVEKLLSHLKVKTLVLPATEEAKSIWTEKFGFQRIPLDRLADHRKTCWQMMTFMGTSMLEKPVPECTVIKHGEADKEIRLQ